MFTIKLGDKITNHKLSEFSTSTMDDLNAKFQNVNGTVQAIPFSGSMEVLGFFSQELPNVDIPEGQELMAKMMIKLMEHKLLAIFLASTVSDTSTFNVKYFQTAIERANEEELNVAIEIVKSKIKTFVDKFKKEESDEGLEQSQSTQD